MNNNINMSINYTNIHYSTYTIVPGVLHWQKSEYSTSSLGKAFTVDILHRFTIN